MPGAPVLLPGVLKPQQRQQRLTTANYLRRINDDGIHDTLLQNDTDHDGDE